MHGVLKFGFLSIAFQIGGVLNAILLTSFGTDLPLMAMFYFYFPAITMVSALDNSVGCGRMIGPVIFGIPLGMILYGLTFGVMVQILKPRPAR